MGFDRNRRGCGKAQALFRGSYQANLARFNLENRLTFVVERTFGTVEEALNFIAKPRGRGAGAGDADGI